VHLIVTLPSLRLSESASEQAETTSLPTIRGAGEVVVQVRCQHPGSSGRQYT
jgi:hypothetical protein